MGLFGINKHSFRKQSKLYLSPRSTLASLQNIAEKSLKDWSLKDVVVWVQSFGFKKYANLFYQNNIDGKTLITLNPFDLKDLGLPIQICAQIFASLSNEKKKVKSVSQTASLNSIDESKAISQSSPILKSESSEESTFCNDEDISDSQDEDVEITFVDDDDDDYNDNELSSFDNSGSSSFPFIGDTYVAKISYKGKIKRTRISDNVRFETLESIISREFRLYIPFQIACFDPHKVPMVIKKTSGLWDFLTLYQNNKTVRFFVIDLDDPIPTTIPLSTPPPTAMRSPPISHKSSESPRLFRYYSTPLKSVSLTPEEQSFQRASNKS